MQDETENRLKLLRRNTKGQLTRTLNVIIKLLSGEDVDIVKEYATKAESNFRKLEEKHEEYMETIQDETTFEEEENWMAECEKEYVQVMLSTKKFISETEAAQSPQQQADQQSASQATSSSQGNQQSIPQASSSLQGDQQSTSQAEQQSTQQSTSQASSSQAEQQSTSQASRQSTATPRMARMKFPTFSGDIKDYKRFKEMFVHCTSGMSEIESFYQLTESMTNTKEKDKIKGCINLNRAWQVLDDCYGDEDKLVDSLLRELENLKTYEHKGKTNLSTMRNFVQTLQNFERQAETLGLGGDLNSKLMIRSSQRNTESLITRA